MGLSGSHVEIKEVKAVYREGVAAAGERQRRALFALCYDMILNKVAIVVHLTPEGGSGLVAQTLEHPFSAVLKPMLSSCAKRSFCEEVEGKRAHEKESMLAFA